MKYSTKLRLSHAVEMMRGVTVFTRLCMTAWFAAVGFLSLFCKEWKDGCAMLWIAICVCPVWDKD